MTQSVADYGEFLPPSHRAYDPALAGGPLLDLGVYLFALATDLAGEATALTARGATVPGRGGEPVNGQLSALLVFDGGARAALAATMGGFTPATFTVVGTEAALVRDGPFNGPGGLTVRSTDGTEPRWDGKPGSHMDGLLGIVYPGEQAP
ncbi:Gfo/Idh/MocA family protein [Arthrobacter silvisoli]|uniref:Gfo/Idh/MocA family protein n=1 Tax=Arthrobacter silvisoli TaxID=2291022 RepID=UPI00109B9CA8|nr:Gfo/Idh/MocA family oxidoreductase [Arthrobacter silvisoli]